MPAQTSPVNAPKLFSLMFCAASRRLESRIALETSLNAVNGGATTMSTSFTPVRSRLRSPTSVSASATVLFIFQLPAIINFLSLFMFQKFNAKTPRCKGAKFLEAIHHPVNSILHITLTKINDQAQLQSRQSQICQHLRLKNRIPIGHGFVINQYQSVHFQIQPQRCAEPFAFIDDRHLQLPLDFHSPPDELFHHRLFINSLQQTRPAQFPMNFNRTVHDDLADLVLAHN